MSTLLSKCMWPIKITTEHSNHSEFPITFHIQPLFLLIFTVCTISLQTAFSKLQHVQFFGKNPVLDTCSD